MREQASPDSTGCHLPAAVTVSCHKHPLGADHPSPGQCLRLDPFYHSSQASAAGRSSSTMHCSQRGHLTPETPSASREVTGAPSNHLQINLPPETRSTSTPDSETPQPQTTQPHHPTRKVQSAATGLCKCCSPACQSAAETSAPLPRQPGRKPAKRALEMATVDQVGLGHPYRAAALVCNSPCSAAPL